ncbi:MAG TPA: hypothetical protein VK586_03540 [Streptosporangiaceae bacterium]|nr:hypothetical protein [Streptosporangiaceae bacterium]
MPEHEAQRDLGALLDLIETGTASIEIARNGVPAAVIAHPDWYAWATGVIAGAASRPGTSMDRRETIAVRYLREGDWLPGDSGALNRVESVSVGTNTVSWCLARDLNAQSLRIDSDVVVVRGQQAPGTQPGWRLGPGQ